METTPSYAVEGPTDNRPLRIEIGTEWVIIVEDHNGIEFDMRGDSGPVVRIEGGALAVLRCSI